MSSSCNILFINDKEWEMIYFCDKIMFDDEKKLIYGETSGEPLQYHFGDSKWPKKGFPWHFIVPNDF